MSNIPELFGSLVFNDDVMREKLPKDIYKSLHKTIENGRELDITVANAVANAMKDWAIENGATHYTHWFQPMTGITAEKHDSFISPIANGKVIMEFSGKELISGEPDASSFPSGGLRATFEARGYTAWDPTSYAFIKDDSLCIPTAFCSYSGEVLDKKTPLLRSMEVISTQACRICHMFGYSDVNRVTSTVGPGAGIFLVDRSMFPQTQGSPLHRTHSVRREIPQGSGAWDHYFGAIKHTRMDFMKELKHRVLEARIYRKKPNTTRSPRLSTSLLRSIRTQISRPITTSSRWSL